MSAVEENFASARKQTSRVNMMDVVVAPFPDVDAFEDVGVEAEWY
jgi:hypothetical protein